MSVFVGMAVAAASLAQEVHVSPDPGALPGGAQLQRIVNGLAGFSLIALAGAAVVGAVAWAIGASGGQYGAISAGKRTVLIALLGALIVGAAPALVNFFRALGGQL